MRQRFFNLLGLLALLGLFGSDCVAWSAPPSLRLQVEPPSDGKQDRAIQVADPFDVVLEVAAPNGARIELPELEATWGDFDVIGYEDAFDIPSNADPTERLWRRRITLESLTAGELKLPPLQVGVFNKGADEVTLETPAQVIVIASVLAPGEVDNLKQYRPIESVLDIPAPSARIAVWRWTGWLAGGLLGLFLAGWGLFRILRRRAVKPITWAQRELAAISAALVEGNDDEQTAVSSLGQVERIVRTFLSHELDPAATSFSPDELAVQLRDAGVAATPRDALVEAITTSSDVKFAGQSCRAADVHSIIQRIVPVLNSIAARSQS